LSVIIKKCEFLYSVPKISLMQNAFSEVAFVGRSNTGKSSLINAVCQKKDLARTSKTPGRTRHAVVYDVVMEKDHQELPVTLVDLPGFGFAAMSKTEAKECEALIYSYIEKRRQLRLLILLLDIRRSLDDRERQILLKAQERKIPVKLVLTKCDKIALAKQKPAIKRVAQESKLEPKGILLHSTSDENYAKELQDAIFLEIAQ